MKLPRPIYQFLSWFPHQEFALMACAVFIIGLFSGKAVMSVGMMLLLGNALINLKVGSYIHSLLADKRSLLLTGLFLAYALSFFWSEDTAYFLTRMQLMLPFLAMPFAFKSLKWRLSYFYGLLFLYVLMSLLGIGWSMYHYALDKETIDAGYGFSKSLPTPFKGDHIRFSMAIVLAFVVAHYLMQGPFSLSGRYKVIGYALATAQIIFVAYLHILASKTGLLSLYLVSFYFLFAWIKRSKKWLLGFGILGLLMLVPITMFYLSDSFRNKLYYTQYSFYQLLNENAETNISDEGRLISYATSFDLIKENVLVGVGAGDALSEMTAAYEKNGIRTEKVLLPHNQFLMVGLCLGVLGLAYFLYTLFQLYRYHFRHSNSLRPFLIIFIIPFLVEAFLETQYGIALFLFFYLFLKALDETEKSKLSEIN